MPYPVCLGLSALQSTGHSVQLSLLAPEGIEIAVAIVLFIVVMAGSMIGLKWLSGRSMSGFAGRNMKVLDRMPLGRDTHLAIVQIGSRFLALSVGKESANLLCELSEKEVRSLRLTQSSRSKGKSPFFNFLLRRDYIIEKENAEEELDDDSNNDRASFSYDDLLKAQLNSQGGQHDDADSSADIENIIGYDKTPPNEPGFFKRFWHNLRYNAKLLPPGSSPMMPTKKNGSKSNDYSANKSTSKSTSNARNNDFSKVFEGLLNQLEKDASNPNTAQNADENQAKYGNTAGIVNNNPTASDLDANSPDMKNSFASNNDEELIFVAPVKGAQHRVYSGAHSSVEAAPNSANPVLSPAEVAYQQAPGVVFHTKNAEFLSAPAEVPSVTIDDIVKKKTQLEVSAPAVVDARIKNYREQMEQLRELGLVDKDIPKKPKPVIEEVKPAPTVPREAEVIPAAVRERQDKPQSVVAHANRTASVEENEPKNEPSPLPRSAEAIAELFGNRRPATPSTDKQDKLEKLLMAAQERQERERVAPTEQPATVEQETKSDTATENDGELTPFELALKRAHKDGGQEKAHEKSHEITPSLRNEESNDESIDKIDDLLDSISKRQFAYRSKFDGKLKKSSKK